MAKHSINLTGSTDSQVIGKTSNNPTGLDGYGATVFLRIDGGSGTFTLQASPDDGTTKYTVKDVNGNDVTGTANGMWNIVSGVGNRTSDFIQYYATLSGGSSADFTVILFDKCG